MPLGLSDNLFKRIVSGVSLLPVVLYPIYQGGWWFIALLSLGGLLMTLEWAHLTQLKSKVAGYLLAGLIVAITVSSHIKALDLPVVTTILVGVGLLGFIMLKAGSQGLAWWLIGVGYVGAAVIALSALRETSSWLVFWVFLVVWATDVGGYFAGKGIGGPKLAPKVSPKKTWAGLAGGVLLSVLVSVVLNIWFGFGSDLLLISLLGAGFAIWAQVGDLVESGIKRHFNVKDSGGLIPGHGGLLDRVDGLVFVAPAAVLVSGLVPSVFS